MSTNESSAHSRARSSRLTSAKMHSFCSVTSTYSLFTKELTENVDHLWERAPTSRRPGLKLSFFFRERREEGQAGCAYCVLLSPSLSLLSIGSGVIGGSCMLRALPLAPDWLPRMLSELTSWPYRWPHNQDPALGDCAAFPFRMCRELSCGIVSSARSIGYYGTCTIEKEYSFKRGL